MSSNGGRAWSAFLHLLQSQKPWMHAQVATLDLTPQLAHTLITLADAGEITMRELADLMFCDASNATGIVDRLEARGLVERRPSERDRRAKVVCLTPAGTRIQKRLHEQIRQEAPPPLAKLSAADQRTLREIVERALAHAEAEREDRD